MNTQSSEKKRYKLLLINPRQYYKHYSIQTSMARLVKKKNTISTLSLPLLAALTPDHYDIRIIDEEVELVPETISADIVGITTLANTSDRGYTIADMFMQRNIPVILGGPHVSYVIEEGLRHATTVVSGEAEPIWHQVLDDFEKGQLQSVYKPPSPPQFKTSPVPRWDLMKSNKYLSFPVQATRGCPYNCEFCLVTKMFGRKLRFREIDNVIAEINALPEKRVFFVDDNLTINKRFANNLVDALAPYNISWSCQASIELADDETLLKKMADAGCDHILIGFESLSTENLEIINKFHNTKADYASAIRKIHAAGIHVFASFIVGLDHDTVKVFDDLYSFSVETAIPYITMNMLGCEPGTDLYERMKKEGRLCESIPNGLKGGMFPMLHYKHMTHSEAYTAYHKTLDRLYSFETALIKAQKLFSAGTFNRPKKDKGFSILQKAVISLKLVWYYLFSGNRAKRKLFLFLFSLFRKNKIAIERVVAFLLSMEGFSRYVKHLHTFDKNNIALCKSLDNEHEKNHTA